MADHQVEGGHTSINMSKVRKISTCSVSKMVAMKIYNSLTGIMRSFRFIVVHILTFDVLQILTITCEHPTYLSVKRFQRTMTTLFNLLLRRHAPCRLNELYIASLAIERYWRYECTRHKFLVSLSRFTISCFPIFVTILQQSPDDRSNNHHGLA